MNMDVWASSLPAECDTIEYELDTSYPRLTSPFYHNLRTKYPRAFRRRDLSASMSDLSSVCSEALTTRSHQTMLSPRTPRGHLENGRRTPGGHVEDGRPPRPPGKGSGASTSDMGIVGVPRPRHRRGLHKEGSQYSSTLSIYSEIVENSRNMLYKSESMVSLRQRLLKNQESWTRLLDDNPPRRLKEHSSQVDLSKVGLSPSSENHNTSLNGETEFNISSDKLKFDKLRELEISLEKMASGQDVKAPPMEPLHVDVDNVTCLDYCKIPTVNGHTENITKKVLPPARRFASPDSHDSAVEMDSASLPSNPSSDNTHNARSICHNGLKTADNKQQAVDSLATSAQDSSRTDRISPIPDNISTVSNHIMPKSNHNLPNSDHNSSKLDHLSIESDHGLLEMDKVVTNSHYVSSNSHDISPQSDCTLGTSDQVTSNSLVPPSTHSISDRPSRARSRTPKLRSRGASPLLGTGPGSSASSVNGDVTPRSRPFCPDQGQMSLSDTGSNHGNSTHKVHHKGRHNKDSDGDSGISQPTDRPPMLIESSEPFYLTDDDTNSIIFVDSSDQQGSHTRGTTSSHSSGPLRGKHQLRQPCQQQGARPKTNFTGSEVNLSTPGLRSRSHDRKREVKFEDEVFGSTGLGNRHRTLSQPVLCGSMGGAGMRYADIVADYGVPPGYDFEQYSDITHGGLYKNKSLSQMQNELDLARNRTILRQDQLSGMPQRRLPNKVPPPPAYNIQSDHRSRGVSPIVAPPRNKQRQQQSTVPQNPANIDKAPQSKPAKSTRSETNFASEMELDQEISGYSSYMEDVDFDGTSNKKKSKLPWKKNKGRFTPTKEVEKITNKHGSLSRSSSRTSLASSFTSEAPSEITVVRRVPSREHVSQEQNMAGNVGHSSRPPPAPKPKHLAQKLKVQQQLSPTEKPPPPPKPTLTHSQTKPHQEHESQKPPSLSKPPIAQKPQQHSKNNPVILRDKHNQDGVQSKPRVVSSPYADIEDMTSGAGHNARSSRGRFSGYEDVDSEDNQLVTAENPYESVVIGRSVHQEEHAALGEEGLNGQEEEEEVIHEAAIDVPTDMYATVNYMKKTHRDPETPANSNHDNSIEYINYDKHFQEDDDENEDDGPPVPHRDYHGNLQSSKELSGSRGSLFNRMDSFKQSAKKKFSKLRKALSIERMDKAGAAVGKSSKNNSQGGEEGGRKNSQSSVPPSPTSTEHQSKFKRSPSLKSLTESLGFVKKIRERKPSGGGTNNNKDDLMPDQRKPPRAPPGLKRPPSISSPETPESPQNFRPIGNIKTVHKDGTQVLELSKPPHGPFGFYIARGNAKCNHGILVSRLSDALPVHFYAGLISVGDEILEINGQEVTSMAIEEVYDLMASETKLTLRTLPYAIRNEI